MNQKDFADLSLAVAIEMHELILKYIAPAKDSNAAKWYAPVILLLKK